MKLQARPKIDMPMSLLNTLLTILTFLLLIGNIVYIGVVWSSLPDRIPTHFNESGKVDGFGGKESLWGLTVVCFILWAGLTLLERFPHIYNYLVEITEQNALRQYKNAQLMINLTKTEITLLFIYLSWKSIRIALGHEIFYITVEVPFILIILFGTIAIFITRSFLLEKK